MSCHMQQSWFTERHLTHWVTKNSCAKVRNCPDYLCTASKYLCVMYRNFEFIWSTHFRRLEKVCFTLPFEVAIAGPAATSYQTISEASVCADIVLVFNIKLLNLIPYSFPEHVISSRCNCKCQIVTYCSYVWMSSVSHLKPMTYGTMPTSKNCSLHPLLIKIWNTHLVQDE